jgi:hypothetical protein
MAIFLISGFGLIYLLRLIFLDITKVSAEILFQRQDLASLAEQAKKSEDFQKFFKKEEANFLKLDAIFVDPKETLDFINFLEKTSRDCDLTLKISSSLLTKRKEDLWPSISFQMTATSPFPNFLKFLEKLESSPYLVEIRDLNISRLAEAETKLEGKEKFSAGDITANLLLKVYTK